MKTTCNLQVNVSTERTRSEHHDRPIWKTPSSAISEKRACTFMTPYTFLVS
jgi:hypothetical protein